MKGVICLITLCLLGITAADQYAWESGRTYVYRGHGRLLAGISEIDTQYTGVDIQYSMQLTVVGPNRVHLKPYNIRVLEVNDKQDGGWRDVPELKGDTPVQIPPNILQYLESPVELKFHKGVVVSIRVEGHTPNYAVNIKKAQISLFILNSAGQNAIMSGNLNRHIPNQVRPEIATTQSGYFFETMEATVLGDCKTYYTLSESGPFESPRTNPIKADLAKYYNSDGSHSEEEVQDSGRSSERRFHYGDDSNNSEESQEYLKHSKYMAYKQLITHDSSELQQSELLGADVFHILCEGKHRLMEFTKTVNYSMCRNKPVLGYASPSFIQNSRAGDNAFGAGLGRVGFSRYVACGKDKKQLTILRIEHEEQIFHGVLRKEKIIGGSVNNLTLVEILPSRPHLPMKDPEEITDLTYTFDPREQKLRRDGKLRTAFEENADQYSGYDEESKEDSNEYPQSSPTDSGEKEENYEMQNGKGLAFPFIHFILHGKSKLKMPSMTQPPLNPMLASPLNKEGMKNRVSVLLNEVVQDLINDEPMAKEEVVSKISTIAKVLRYLAYDDIEVLYHRLASKAQTDEDKIGHRIFLDCVSMAGTNPNSKFLIDLIKKQTVTGEEAAQLVMTMSMYIRTPTQELIHYFFRNLVDFSPRSENMDQLQTSAVLSFTNLLHDACVNTQISDTRYPIQVYKEFCNEAIVRREYLPHLVKNLKTALERMHEDENSIGASHWATVYVAALGNTGHPKIIEEVQKVLDTETNPFIKAKAVWALSRLLVSRSNQNVPTGEEIAADRKNRDCLTDEVIEKRVLPILTSVTFDKTESQDVRMAAVSMLVRATSADITIWQKLALSSWSETNQQVHSYIYKMIWNLSNMKRPVDPVMLAAHKRALAVLPLVKPINIGLPQSSAYHEADYYDDIQSGFTHCWSQLGSENSAFPNSFFYKDYKYYADGAIGDSPLEFSTHGHTLSHIIQHFIGKFHRPTESMIEGNDIIKQIAEALHIVNREQDEPPQTSIQIKLRDEMERIFSINRESIDMWVEELKRNYIPQLINGFPINYQKSMKLQEANYEFPTIFGIPAHVVLTTNNLFSLRGSVKVAGTKNLQQIQLNVELHPILSYKHHSHISFKSPFSGKAYQAGVELHALTEFPFRAMVDKSNGKLKLAVTPTHLSEGNVGGAIDLITFHRRPYTICTHDDLWPISHKEGGQMKIVHAVDTPFKQVREFGQNSLGFAFKTEQETEFQPESEGFSAWARYFQRFRRTWSGWLHMGPGGSKTLRFAQRKLTLDVSESKTKTLSLIFAGRMRGWAANVVSESSKENFNNDESGQFSGEVTPETYRQNYDEKYGDYQHNMDKSIKQRSYQDYYMSQYERSQRSLQMRERSEDSPEDIEGQLKYPSYNYRNYRAPFNSYEYQYQRPETNMSDMRQRHWLVVALIGKTSPLSSPLKLHGFQNQHESAPSSFQYMLSLDSYPGHAELYVSAGESTKEHAAMLPQNSAAVEGIRRDMNSGMTSHQQSYCGVYTGNYEFPDWANRKSILVSRQNLLRQDLKVKINGEISFGESFQHRIHKVAIKGELSRDQEMLNFAKTDSFEAKQCNEDEKKGFYSSPVCIVNSEQQAAALNFAKLEIKSTALPIPVLNATLQVREFVKAMLYPYMSYNPFRTSPMNSDAAEESLNVEARLKPENDYFTLKFFRPSERIFFEDIELSSLAQSVFPLTGTQTLFQNVRDRVFKSEASCSVEGPFVSTFDNVTYNFDTEAATNCQHVLVQDCSGKKAVSVLAENVGTGNLVTTVLLPGNFRITLMPQIREDNEPHNRAYVTATTNTRVTVGKGRVLVNGVPVESVPANVNDKKGHFIARIEEAAGASLQLFAQDIKVITDGRHIVVYPSNMLRNATCGLCGNFDVRKTSDFRSPRDCQLSTGTLLMAAYAIQNPWDKKTSGECKIAEDVKRGIEREERDCQAVEFLSESIPESCQDELVREVGDAVYVFVENALRRIPGINSSKWAEMSRERAREILEGPINAEDIARIVATEISKMIPVVGRRLKGVIEAAVEELVKEICSESGCCDAHYFK